MTHPYFWPHVARGAEREIHDLGTRLAGRGHEVDLWTGQPRGLTSRAVVDGVRVRYVRTPLPSSLARRGWTRESAFGGLAAVGAAVSRADVVLSFLYADAYGASLSRHLPGRRGRPLVLKLTGSAPLSYLEAQGQRLDRALLRRALDAADEVWVNSRYVQEAMADWDRPMHVVPAGLDPEVFAPSAPRSPEPLVLCTAAPAEPRKRVADLLAAWGRIRSELPGATLVVAQSTSAHDESLLRTRLDPADRGSVRFAGRLGDEELARAYSSAWVTVAPAVYEALGLATLESLACGTPVAGARSGATPELLSAPGTGTLFTPGDAESLAAAVVAAAELARQPATGDVCRAAALRYAWPGIVDDVERRLGRLVAA
ncbi:MAG: glycosyltransferase family 4 protein [Mycobacteriales bacterium]